ncbi:MAG TPA: DNA repair protein RadA, partial [Steroidobacteraceae bacterium]|nr:DNA repair protein RadA [Steroidobacteraceae bacterium]
MAKVRTLFLCSACGASASKWQGQCSNCGEWNSLEAAPAGRPVPHASTSAATQLRAVVEPEVERRISTGLSELDRVLGGGLVIGSVALLGGDPGIGKSTLLLQAAVGIGAQVTVLYATGEESLHQVGMRARRLGLQAGAATLIAETSVERVIAEAQQLKAGVVVIDSIQTMATEASESAPGAVAQLRESAAALVRFAKQSGTAVLLIGHVTKEGVIAGPRVLEHMVDTVLYFESDSGSRYRIVRAVKNRFGAANEIGVFAMSEGGLKEVRNPSAIFLSRDATPSAGSIVTVAREGTRPLLVEVQVLVDDSVLANPRRVAVGLDANRLAMLLAVLHRHAGIAMHGTDVFANVVGGVRIAETSADLPTLLAAVSSLRDRPLPQDLAAFGELGLAGEVRPVPYGEERIREAA